MARVGRALRASRIRGGGPLGGASPLGGPQGGAGRWVGRALRASRFRGGGPQGPQIPAGHEGQRTEDERQRLGEPHSGWRASGPADWWRQPAATRICGHGGPPPRRRGPPLSKAEVPLSFHVNRFSCKVRSEINSFEFGVFVIALRPSENLCMMRHSRHRC